MENQFQFPTEVVDLPSKGLLYPKDSPLSSGTIEMKYMTAKEEDILTNQNYIQKGLQNYNHYNPHLELLDERMFLQMRE